MVLGTVVSWGTWLSLLWSQDPGFAPVWVLGFFYLSFFLGFLGLVSTGSLMTRVVILRRQTPLFKEVVQSFRQGVLWSALMVIGLFLQHHHFLTWWNAFLLVATVSLFEFFIVSTHVSRSRRNYIA